MTLTSDLNVRRLPPDVPATVRTALRGSLEKDPKQLVHEIADVRLAMASAFETTVSAPAEPAAVFQPRIRQRPVTMAVVALVSLAVGGVGVWSLTRPGPSPSDLVTRFLMPLAGDQNFSFVSRPLVAISPRSDGIEEAEG